LFPNNVLREEVVLKYFFFNEIIFLPVNICSKISHYPNKFFLFVQIIFSGKSIIRAAEFWPSLSIASAKKWL